MIHFVVATNSEARPLIDLFKLKKIKDLKQAFIYANQNISLIIPKHRPLPQISQLFAEKLEESVRNIINLTKLEFQLDSLEEFS